MKALFLSSSVLAAFILVACGDASSVESLRGATTTPHDDQPTVGEHEVDPGNPNADANPVTPTSTGTATDIEVSLDNATPALDLGAQLDLTVTVSSKGYTGPASLTVTGLPAGVTATFATPTVTVGTAPLATKLTLKSDATAVPSAANTSSPLVVTATNDGKSATANANFKVNPKLTLVIPMNIDALRQAGGTQYRNEWGTAFGATPSPLLTQAGNPIVVLVRNADSAPHIVHGNNGFAHGDTSNPVQPNAFEMQNGAPRQRSLPVGAMVNGYPHDGTNGSSAAFQISVKAAP